MVDNIQYIEVNIIYIKSFNCSFHVDKASMLQVIPALETVLEFLFQLWCTKCTTLVLMWMLCSSALLHFHYKTT